MRRLLVIAAALGMMLSLHSLSLEGELGATDPLTLAAIGFVVLAAFVIGELGARFGLPKVTGYIVGGVLLGPHVSDILSHRVVSEMQVFNTLALGLIATTAGLELDLGAIRKVWRTLTATVVLKIPALLLLVGGAFWLIQSLTGAVEMPGGAAVPALALILAVLGIGTSPAIALAVVNETGAKGRLSDLVLALAVVKDLVVVVCLALAIAVARTMISPEGALDAHVLLDVGKELGLSIALGLVTGAVVIAYLRFLRAEMLLFVVAVVLLVAEASHWLHLELLLVLITAGFVVRNLSSYEHELLAPLQRVALPVFVVFFTTAGANVNLAATLAVLPVALALAAARALAFFGASHLGGRLGGESAAVRSNGWMAYLPQAGVTLGLVFLAARALPELEAPIRQVGMALVALHLILGPVLMSLALRRAGELPQAARAIEAEAAARPETPREAPEPAPPASDDDGPPPLPTIDQIADRLEDPALGAEVRALGRELTERLSLFHEADVKSLADFGRRTVSRLLDDVEDGREASAAVARVLESAPPEAPEAWETNVLSLFKDLTRAIQARPAELESPLTEEAMTVARGAGPAAAVRRVALILARRLSSRWGHSRSVPVCQIARIALEGRLARVAETTAASFHRALGGALGQVRFAVDGVLEPDAARQAVALAFEAWQEQVAADLAGALRRGLEEQASLMATVGAPGAPRGSLRYSRVEPRLRRALGRIEADREAWRALAAAAFNSLRASVALRRGLERLDVLLEQQAWGALEIVHDEALPVTVAVTTRLLALRRDAETKGDLDSADLDSLLSEARRCLDEADLRRLRHARVDSRKRARKSRLITEVRAIVDAVPERLELLPFGMGLDEIQRPAEVVPQQVELAREVDRALTELLLPQLNQALSSVSAQLASCEPRLREALHVATYGLEVLSRGKLEDASVRQEVLLTALERAINRSRQVALDLEASLGQATARLETEQTLATSRLRQLAGERRPSAEALQATMESHSRALVEALVTRLQSVVDRLRRGLRSARLSLSKRRELQDWLIAAGQQRLDAAAMSRLTLERTPGAEALRLPRLYLEAFSADAVDDRRLLAARRGEVEEVLRAVSTPKRRAAVLIVGEPGSGRTSLLNELEYRTPERRVIRLDAAYHRRPGGVLGALATELGCPARDETLQDELRRDARVVLIDDLEHFIEPTPAGLTELERFFQLVVDASTTQWVVTTSGDALRRLEGCALPTQEVFLDQLQLEPLGWRELREVAQTRQRLAGVTPSYAPLGGLTGRLLRRRTTEEALYFRALARAAGGNLREALLAHLRSLREGERGEALLAQRPERAILPFLGQLPSTAQAILALLVCFGPLRAEELAEALLIEAPEVRGHVTFLERALVVVREHGPGGELLIVPAHLENALVNGLRELHVLAEVP